MWHDKPTDPGRVLLEYDQTRWKEVVPRPVNTLQIFITNECNLRCRGCFYERGLGRGEMTMEEYGGYLDNYVRRWDVKKITLLGGEPTMHPRLAEIIALNTERGLNTAIYTNGHFLDRLKSVDL